MEMKLFFMKPLQPSMERITYHSQQKKVESLFRKISFARRVYREKRSVSDSIIETTPWNSVLHCPNLLFSS